VLTVRLSAGGARVSFDNGVVIIVATNLGGSQVDGYCQKWKSKVNDALVRNITKWQKCNEDDGFG
jgi:hypothetical protein